MSEEKDLVGQLAKDLGGEVTETNLLPDGSGFSVLSIPLPKDHWLYKEGINVPPMPFRMGNDDPRREAWEKAIWEAGKFAVRGATMNGKEMDFDPDALLQNLVVGMLGYYTPDGLSSDDSANPVSTKVTFKINPDDWEKQ